MPKVPVHQHITSYQAITSKSPQGLQCLKKLFTEYDNENPSRGALESLFAGDFTDNENESERNIGRVEVIENIISSRQRYSRHQIDLKRAICIEHDPRKHEVLFEGVRFMLFPLDPDRELELPIVEDKGDWLRVPFSGRIEVRVRENRFSLKDAMAEIVARRWTVDHSQMVRREMSSRRRTATDTSAGADLASPASNGSGILLRNQSSSSTPIGLPGGVSELPAALSGLTAQDSKSLPPYPHSEVGTPTVISGISS